MALFAKNSFAKTIAISTKSENINFGQKKSAETQHSFHFCTLSIDIMRVYALLPI